MVRGDSVELDYPEHSELVMRWDKHACPWIISAKSDFDCGEREKAKEALVAGRIDKLVEEKYSRQKTYDMFGAAAVLKMVGEPLRSKDLFLKLADIIPYAGIYVEIANICKETSEFLDRVKYLEMAHEVWPENAVIVNYLGSALMRVNQKERGFELLRKSLESNPGNSIIYSNFLHNSHYAEEYDCQKMFDDHKRWAKYNAPSDLALTVHKNVADPARKLRIGYISPDFLIHPVGLIIKPIIDHHDRNEVELFGYGNVERRDDVTDYFEKKFDHYRDIYNVSDKKVVECIVADKVDILVDLAGHTRDGRPGVLAYKPAPIQVTYLGYFDTTGMDQVDYFLTDSQMSPPETQKYHTEKLFCLPNTCFCYNIPQQLADVAESPFLKNGFITFGMYSNPKKLTSKMAGLWTRIINNTKGSRFRLVFDEAGNDRSVSSFATMLEDAGMPLDRVDIHKKMVLKEYFQAYGKVDIMLDTYPYNGGATTCDAFWMGVPVISLVGEHHFSRVGLSLLTAVGLDYFAAKTEEEYVARATVLAVQPESLARIRNTLRQRVKASAISNTPLQVKNFENAYREMWHRWCREQNGVGNHCFVENESERQKV